MFGEFGIGIQDTVEGELATGKAWKIVKADWIWFVEGDEWIQAVFQGELPWQVVQMMSSLWILCKWNSSMRSLDENWITW